LVLVDRAIARRALRSALEAVAVAAGLVLLLDGAIFNPTGFRARLAFLAGPASRDYATYAATVRGRESVVDDVVRAFSWHYPDFLAPFAVLGLLLAIAGATRAPARASRVVAAAIPAMVAASFTFAFNLVALRVEERFTMPQMLAAAVYAGIGLERVASAFDVRVWLARALGSAIAGALLVAAVWRSVALDANLLADPRYDAEAWLRSNVRPGDDIEVHGLSVYLIRFPPGARVSRVGPTPIERRNPMAGVTEVQAPLSAIDARRPRYVVANECFAGFFRGWARGGPDGRIEPTSMRRDDDDTDATTFFRALFDGRLPYRLVHESRFVSPLFPRIFLHGSVGCPVFVFERAD
jgi:hypothetical protein